MSPVSRGRKSARSSKAGKPVRRRPGGGSGASRLREPGFLAGRDVIIENLAKLLDIEDAASPYEAEALGSVVLGLMIEAGMPGDAIVRVVLDVVDELERRDAAHSYAALRVLAVVGPPEVTEYAAQAAAIGRAQAVVEFTMDGAVITANENFLHAMGYSLAEIKGRHHSMFVEPSSRDGAPYREFWAKLNRGEFQSGEFKRIGKGGREVWIRASYNPVFDQNGKPFKVVKFATDITASKLRNADLAGQIAAIGKSQAVIEFAMDGTIITANDNFLKALGYSLSDIKGRHHSMFVDPAERDTAEYREFWAKLNRGEYQTGEFKRIGNGGKDVWIQATYNPILDLNGKPFKVVKYASDTTAQVVARLQGEKVSGMMDQVAAGAEELNASVREISEAMTKSKDTAATAVDQVEAADQQAQRLSAAAESMRSIVQLIGDITGQINLLALNATIESARAGEAGRGFAVVASEVKNLANQAKQATDKIDNEIGSLNGISGDVVTALGTIKKAIQDVAEYVNSTAAAVEEQSAVTSEMSTNMQRAAAEAAAIGSRAA